MVVYLYAEDIIPLITIEIIKKLIKAPAAILKYLKFFYYYIN